MDGVDFDKQLCHVQRALIVVAVTLVMLVLLLAATVMWQLHRYHRDLEHRINVVQCDTFHGSQMPPCRSSSIR